MKKISLLLVALLLVTSFASFASEAKVVSLEEAIELALKEDLGLKTFDLDITIAERDVYTAKKNADDYKGVVLDEETQAQYNLTKEFYPKQQELALKQLKDSKTAMENGVKLSVTKSYYALSREEKSLKDAKDNLATSLIELEQLKTKLKQGLVTSLDVETKELSIKREEAQIEKQEAMLSRSMMNFNQTLGLPIDTVLSLSDAYTALETVPEYNVKEVTSKMQTTATSVVKLDEKLQLENDKLALIYPEDTKYQYPNSYYPQKKTIENVEKDIVKEQKAIELKVRIDINNIENLKADVKIAELTLALEQKAFNIASTKHDLGLIDEVTFTANKDALEAKEDALDQAEYQLYLSVLDFEDYLKGE